MQDLCHRLTLAFWARNGAHGAVGDLLHVLQLRHLTLREVCRRWLSIRLRTGAGQRPRNRSSSSIAAISASSNSRDRV